MKKKGIDGRVSFLKHVSDRDQDTSDGQSHRSLASSSAIHTGSGRGGSGGGVSSGGRGRGNDALGTGGLGGDAAMGSASGGDGRVGRGGAGLVAASTGGHGNAKRSTDIYMLFWMRGKRRGEV